MKIFVDFDGVIFDAKKFKNALARACAKHGISKKAFLHTYALTKESGGVYSISRHLRLLVKNTKNRIQKKALRAAIDHFMCDLRSCVFKDASGFLTHFKKHDLYLLSFGDPAFQKRKIEGSGVKRYFKRIIVTQNNKGNEIMTLRDKNAGLSDEISVFIDDSEKHIREVRRIKNVIIIQMQRDKNDTEFLHANHHVSTLAQATRVIVSL